MPTDDKNRAFSALPVICNAESAKRLLSLSSVLECLKRQKQTVTHLQAVAGLGPDSGNRMQRERFEITQGKLLALDNLAVELSGLPAENLTVEKPSTLPPFVKSDVSDVREVLFQLRGKLALLPLSSEIDSAWHRADAAMRVCDSILERLSGSAEEQPLNSEETPEPIGKPPVTVPASNLAFRSFASLRECLPNGPGEWFSSLSVPELEELSESALDALESRGAVVHWSLTGA